MAKGHAVPGDPDAAARLAALEKGASVEAASAFFDSLAPVPIEQMLGTWRGSGLATGHPITAHRECGVGVSPPRSSGLDEEATCAAAHDRVPGVATATMCYDALPVHDAFRGVDDDTVLGLMDMRGMLEPFIFVLRREAPVDVAR